MRLVKTPKTAVPYVQYSKKITTTISLFWCLIRVFTVIAVFINPDCGPSMNAIIRGIDDIEMVIVISYTGNSISEKVATSYFAAKAAERSGEKLEDTESTG